MIKADVLTGEIITGAADEINHEHELCLLGQKDAVEHAFRCGYLLSEQKASLEHGEWLPWVMMNCRFSDETARKYMLLSSNSNRGWNLSDVTSIRSALRLLSAPEKKKEAPKEEPKVEVNPFSVIQEAIGTIKTNVSVLLKADKESGADYYLKMTYRMLHEISDDLWLKGYGDE